MDANSTGGGVLNKATDIPEPRNPSARLEGIDLSHHNDVDSWEEIASAVQFAYFKATENVDFVDGKFRTFFAAAKQVGIIRGAYHFLRFDHSGHDQADFFLNTVGPITGEDFLVLDWEVKGPLTVVREFLDQVKARAGRRCFVYVNYFVAQETEGDKSFLAEYPLIVPNYSKEPGVPAPWKAWNVWQDSEAAKVPGIPSTADHDVFRGDIQDFRDLVKWTVLG